MNNPGLEKLALPAQTQRRVYPRRLFDEEDEGRGLHPRDVPERGYVDPEELGRSDFGNRLPRRDPGATIKNIDESIADHGIHEQPVTEEEERSADRILAGDHLSDHPSTDAPTEAARRALRSPAGQEAVATASKAVNAHAPAPQAAPHAPAPQTAQPSAPSPLIAQHFQSFKVGNGQVVAQGQNGNKQVAQIPQQSGQPYVLHNAHGSFAMHDSNHLLTTLFAFQIISDMNQRHKDDQNWNAFPSRQHTSAVEKHVGYDDTCPACGYGYLVPNSPFMHECLNCGSLISVGELVAKTLGKKAAPAKRPGGLGPRRPLGDQPYDPDAPGEGRLDMFFADPESRPAPDPDTVIEPHITTKRDDEPSDEDEIIPIEGEHVDPYIAPGRGQLLGSTVNPGLARHAAEPMPRRGERPNPEDHQALTSAGWFQHSQEVGQPFPTYYKHGRNYTHILKYQPMGETTWHLEHMNRGGLLGRQEGPPLPAPTSHSRLTGEIGENTVGERLKQVNERAWSPVYDDFEPDSEHSPMRRLNGIIRGKDVDPMALAEWRREHPGLRPTEIDEDGLLHYSDPDFVPPLEDEGTRDESHPATDQALFKLKGTDPYVYRQRKVDTGHPPEVYPLPDEDDTLAPEHAPAWSSPNTRMEEPDYAMVDRMRARGERPVW